MSLQLCIKKTKRVRLLWSLRTQKRATTGGSLFTSSQENAEGGGRITHALQGKAGSLWYMVLCVTIEPQFCWILALTQAF